MLTPEHGADGVLRKIGSIDEQELDKGDATHPLLLVQTRVDPLLLLNLRIRQMIHHVLLLREKPALDGCSAAWSGCDVGRGSRGRRAGDEHVGGEVEVENLDCASPNVENSICGRGQGSVCLVGDDQGLQETV